MSIRFEDTGPPAGEDDLAELEERAGRPLPVSYRDFLEAHDGVTPEDNRLPDAVGGADIAVRSFYSAEEVVRQLELLGPDRVPDELLPIAGGDDGNNLFLHLEDGSIWSFDHDEEDPEELDLWAAFTREAEDMDELLDRLEAVGEELEGEVDPLAAGYVEDETLRDGTAGTGE